jgi:hypothetical protein
MTVMRNTTSRLCKRLLGRHGHRWKDNVELDPEMMCEGVD